MTRTRHYYVLGVALAAATAVALVLAMGALGIVGDGGRADRIFLAVPVVLLLGALVARFRPRGMVVAASVTAAAQAVAAVVAIVAVSAEVEDFAGASIADIAMVNTVYAAGFAVSARLFRRSVGPRTASGQS